MTPKQIPTPPYEPSFTLAEAATQYIISLSDDKKIIAQQEVNRFIRWYGGDRIINALTVPEVSNYAEQITSSTTETPEKLEPVKDFLTFAHKKGWITIKLATHIKIVRRSSQRSNTSTKKQERIVSLSAKGYSELQAEIEALKNERPKIIEDIQKARADKDFRENAPLDAAREQLAKLEARIRDLEATLKVATIIDDKTLASSANQHGITIGNTVTVKDLTTSELIEYTLVDAREANPIHGKISVASPIGKALLNHKKGEQVEVKAPAGSLPYLIEAIKQN